MDLFKAASFANGNVIMVNGHPTVRVRTNTLPFDVTETLSEDAFKSAFGADGSFIKSLAEHGYDIECNGWRFTPVQTHRATEGDDTASVLFIVNNAVLDKRWAGSDVWFFYLLTYEAETIFVECSAINNRNVAGSSSGGGN